jgi:hypothetical protein
MGSILDLPIPRSGVIYTELDICVVRLESRSNKLLCRSSYFQSSHVVNPLVAYTLAVEPFSTWPLVRHTNLHKVSDLRAPLIRSHMT